MTMPTDCSTSILMHSEQEADELEALCQAHLKPKTFHRQNWTILFDNDTIKAKALELWSRQLGNRAGVIALTRQVSVIHWEQLQLMVGVVDSGGVPLDVTFDKVSYGDAVDTLVFPYDIARWLEDDTPEDWTDEEANNMIALLLLVPEGTLISLGG